MKTKNEMQSISTSSKKSTEPVKKNRIKSRKGPVKKTVEKLVDEFWMMVADLITWTRLVLGVVTEHAIALAIIILFHANF
ncbi:hypothetical protein [Dyadobacter frigoris]|uniref:Uncharacterized protein n=1 Tax=Dyadobacter frigoris TaxID=2576211 RepID=A0A4U6D0C3_9BACT|nr:hypothetical protein [Dyadobacter frigoris]TKT90630.1 hypothetical protein FDK13_20115 [Dyadobacter frigoris]GLU51221.1 hypothetical protein Dfri01_06820 [Dyadobacter frigoris]